MNTFLGIGMETWVNIDRDCDMNSEVSRTEAQIELGHRTGSLHLVVCEEGLATLAEFLDGVLTELRAKNT